MNIDDAIKNELPGVSAARIARLEQQIKDLHDRLNRANISPEAKWSSCYRVIDIPTKVTAKYSPNSGWSVDIVIRGDAENGLFGLTDGGFYRAVVAEAQKGDPL